MRDFDLDDIRWIIDGDPLTYDITGDEFLDNRYNQPNNSQPYYRLFYVLSQFLEPDIVIELGAYQGTAAAHFASGYPECTVVTIDHHTDPGDDDNKTKVLMATAEYDNLYYIQGWTNDTLAKREKGKHKLGSAPNALIELGNMLFDTEGIDILFIDSWHQYEEAMLDWRVYSRLLNSPALVICDDIIGGDGPAIGGMLDFWNELPGEKFLSDKVHIGYPMGFLKYE